MKEPENKIEKFPAASLEDWEGAATDELQGSNPWTKLTQVHHGLSVKPYYGPDKVNSSSLQLLPAKDSFLGPRRWHNCPRVIVGDPAKANQEALQHLQQGADGIFFEMVTAVDLRTMLQSIDWPSCSLNFLAKENAAAISRSLAEFLPRTNQPIPGAFFSPEPVLGLSHPSFRFIGHSIPSMSSPIDALATGFTGLIERIGTAFKERAGDVAFFIEVGEDFFMEIAKLRALRIVWEKILSHKGAKRQEPVYIHAYSLPWTKEQYSPHGNMLKSTTASMSAILGGCDALTVDPEDSRQPMMNRVARNVSNILREESHFSLVADPVSGSYFIEDLSLQIAEGTFGLLKKKGLA